MFNTELEKIYTHEGIVENLRKLAANFEGIGCKAMVCSPRSFEDVTFPYVFYVDAVRTDQILEAVQDVVLSLDFPIEVQMPESFSWPTVLPMEYYKDSKGGMPLWVV